MINDVIKDVQHRMHGAVEALHREFKTLRTGRANAAMLDGIDHVQLAAPPGCEAEARRFFGELLGLAEIEKPESLRARGGVWFQVGAQQLHVGVEREFAPARKAHPALLVDDLDSLVARLAGAGVEVTWDDAIPGVRRCYVADPFGNRLELVPASGG